MFDELNFRLQNGLLLKYKQLMNGINPKTKRKIKIGGRTYQNIEHELFYLKQKDMEGRTTKMVPFQKLMDIDQSQYINETKELRDRENVLEGIVIEHNKRLVHIRSKIKNLKDWNDFVEVDGEKYGLPEVICNKVFAPGSTILQLEREGKVHKKNDCNGKMIYIKDIVPFSYKTYVSNFDLCFPSREVVKCEYKCNKCDCVIIL